MPDARALSRLASSVRPVSSQAKSAQGYVLDGHIEVAVQIRSPCQQQEVLGLPSRILGHLGDVALVI